MCFVVFFSFSIGVKADYERFKSKELYSECNDSNQCVPICIYSCQNNSDVCNDRNNFAYIGHYYGSSSDSDGLRNIWSIGALSEVSSRSARTTQLFLWTNTFLPNENIVQVSVDGKTDWKDSYTYNSVLNNFKCPNYSTIHNGLTKDELYFSNVEQKKYSTLTYSFIDEFEKVLNDAEMEAEMFDLKYEDINKNDRVNEFLKIMNKAGLNDSFDSSLSSDENIKKFCESTNATDAKNYVNKVDIEKTINAILSLSIENYNVRFPNVYTYSNLQTLFDGSNNKDVVNVNGDSYKDRINALYKDINSNMITYLNEDCNWNITESDLNQAVAEKLESVTHALTDIDLDEKFDCDTLLGGDVAKLISGAYFIIEIGAIAIFIVFTVLDYAKAILSGEADEIKKCNQKLVKRLIIVAVIFLLPALVNTVLRLFHIEGFNSDHPLCIDISNK